MKNFDLALRTVNFATEGGKEAALITHKQSAEEAALERAQRVRDLEMRLMWEEENEINRFKDIPLEVTAAALSGAGQIIGGAGAAMHAAESAVRGPLKDNALLKVGNFLQDSAQNTRDAQSGLYREMLDNSQPTGDLTAPSTWSMGERPTIEGFLTNVLGSVVEETPAWAATLLAANATGGMSLALAGTSATARTTAAAGRIVGAKALTPAATYTAPLVGAGMYSLQAGGAQARDSAERIRAMSSEEFIQHSPNAANLFGKRLASEIPKALQEITEVLGTEPSETEVLEIIGALSEKVGNEVKEEYISSVQAESFATGAASGMAGGYLMGRMFTPSGAKGFLSGTKKVAGAAVIEGAQEPMEGMGGRLGYNIITDAGISITEGTFGEFVMGASAGGVMGGIGAAVSEEAPEQPTLEEIRGQVEVRLAADAKANRIEERLGEITSISEAREELLNDKSENYSPFAMMHVLNKVATTTPEVFTDENLKTEFIQTLETSYSQLKRNSVQRAEILERSAIDPSTLEEWKTEVNRAEQAIAAGEVSEQDMEWVQKQIVETKKAIESVPVFVDMVAKEGGEATYRANNQMINAQLVQAEKVYQHLAAKADPIKSYEGLQKEVERLDSEFQKQIPEGYSEEASRRVVMFAMSNPKQFESDEAQQFLKARMATAPQQVVEMYDNIQKVRKLADQHIASNKKKGITDVFKDILKGNKKDNHLGLEEYLDRIPKAIFAGRTKEAATHLGYLSSFAESHGNKAAAVRDALNRAAQTGKQFKAVPVGENMWIVSQGMEKDAAKRAAHGIVNISKSSVNLVHSIEQEAKLISDVASILADVVANGAGTDRVKAAFEQMAQESQYNEEKAAKQPEKTEEERAAFREEVQPVEETVDKVVEPITESESEPTSETVSTTSTEPEVVSEDTVTDDFSAWVEEETVEASSDQVEFVETESDSLVLTGEEGYALPYTFVVSQGVKHDPSKQNKLNSLIALADEIVGQRNTEDSAQHIFDALDKNENKVLEWARDVFPNHADSETKLHGLVISAAHYVRQIEESALQGRSSVNDVAPIGARFTTYNNSRGKGTRSLLTSLFVSDQEFNAPEFNQKPFRVGTASEQTKELYKTMAQAVITAADSWVLNNASSPTYQTPNALRKFFGLEDFENPENFIRDNPEYAAMAWSTNRENMVDQLGKHALRAAKLKIHADLPVNVEVMVRAHLGAMTLQYLVDQGVITKSEIKAPVTGRKTNVYGVSPDTIQDGATQVATHGGAYLKEIENRADMLEGVLSDLTERALPSTQVNTKAATDIKNTVMSAPSKLKEDLKRKQHLPHKLNKGALSFIQSMLSVGGDDGTNNTLAQVLGFKSPQELARLIKPLRVTAETRNKEIMREIAELKRAIDTFGDGDKEFFYDRFASLQQRTFYNNAFNPQENKFFRIMITMPDWVHTIEGGDKELNSFATGIAEAFGVKSDSQAETLNIQAGQEYLSKAFNVLKAWEQSDKADTTNFISNLSGFEAAVVQLAANNDPSVTATHKKGTVIRDFIQKEENFHTLHGLIETVRAAQYAMESGDQFNLSSLTGFQSMLWREVDGKTNGPMFAMLMMGMNDTNRDIYTKGGFLSKDTGFSQLSEYNEDDLYKTTAGIAISTFNSFAMTKPYIKERLEIFEHFFGVLTDGSGKASKQGRNFAKPLVTQTFYSAGVESIIKGKIAKELLVDAVYQKFDKAITDLEDGLTDLDTVGNALLEDARKLSSFASGGNLQELGLFNRLRAAFETFGNSEGKAEDFTKLRNSIFLTEVEINTIAEAAFRTFREPLSSVFEDPRFNTYMGVTQGLNALAGVSFSAYQAARGLAIEEATQEANLPKRKGKETPAFDLPKSKLKAIDRRLSALMPWTHSAMSVADGNKAGQHVGIMLAKMDGLREVMSQTTINFEAMANQGLESGSFSGLSLEGDRVASDPGVGTVVKAVQSTDAAVAHSKTVGVKRMNGEYEDRRHLLNVHDAKITAAHEAAETGRALNKATVEAMIEYSLPLEIVHGFERTMSKFSQHFRKMFDESGNERTKEGKEVLDFLANQIFDAIAKAGVKGNTIRGKNLLSRLYLNNFKAAKEQTLKKLDFMLNELEYVDQYTINGGAYKLSPADRAAIQKKIDEVKAIEPSVSALSSLAQIESVIGNVSSISEQNVQEFLVDRKEKNPAEKRAEIVQNIKDILESDGAIKLLSKEQQKAMGHRKSMAAFSMAIRDTQGFTLGDAIRLAYGTEANSQRRNPVLGEILRLAQMADTATGKLGKIPVLIMTNANKADMLESLVNQYGESFRSSLEERVNNLGMNGNTHSYYVMNKGEDGKVSEAIILKAEGFKHTDGTTYEFELEAFAHEAWHAVTLTKVLTEKGKSEGKQSEAFKRINQLHKVALNYLNDPSLIKNQRVRNMWEAVKEQAPTITSIEEFVAVGMTNKVLMRAMAHTQLVESQSQLLSDREVKILRNEKNLLARFANAIMDFLNIGNLIARLSNAQVKRNMMTQFLFANHLMTKSGHRGYATDRAKLLGSLSGEAIQIQPMATVPAGSQTVADMTSTDVFDALVSSRDDADTSKRLKGILETVTEKVLGRSGTLGDAAFNQQTVRPEEVYHKALSSGRMPFASRALANPALSFTDQQAFALEQIEAVFAGNLIHSHALFKSLENLFTQAEESLTDEHFFTGDWATASQAERDTAAEIREAVFTRVASEDSNYLAQFAATALSNPVVNRAMQKVRVNNKEVKGKTFAESLENAWNKVADVTLGDSVNLNTAKDGTENIQQILNNLVDIEGRNKNKVLDTLSDASNYLEGVADKGFDFVKDTMSDALDRQYAKVKNVDQSSYNVKRKGAIAAIEWTQAFSKGELSQQMQNIFAAKQRHDAMKGNERKLGWLASTASEVRGAWDSVSNNFQALIRSAKYNEHQRMQKALSARTNLMNAFDNAGAYLSAEDSAAITEGLLRTDVQSLLSEYDLSDIEQMFTESDFLDSERNFLREQLYSQYPQLAGMWDVAIKDLAYYKAKEEVTSKFLLMNADQIASLTGISDQVSEGVASQVRDTIDRLITLDSIHYTDSRIKQRIATVMDREGKKKNEEGAPIKSGIEVVLAYHKKEQETAIELEFMGDRSQAEKGYLIDILNDKKIAVKATADEGKRLEKMGYVKGPLVTNDDFDTFGAPQYLYSFRNGGMNRILTGAMSYTSSNLAIKDRVNTKYDINGFEDVKAQEAMLRDIKRKKVDAFKELAKNGNTYDPAAQKAGQMVPIFGRNGAVNNFHYVNSKKAKDNLLDRNSDFSDVLSKMVAQSFDLVASEKQNETVVEALYEAFTTDKRNLGSYMEISADSNDPELRELFNLIPQKTKAHIEKVWGSQKLYIRNDQLDHIFGYRKYTLASSLKKEAMQRTLVEKGYATVMEAIFDSKAELRGAQVAEMWDNLIKHIRDMAVVKNLYTLALNITSNGSQLILEGLSVKEAFTLQREGLRNVLAYRKDSAELEEIQQLVNLGIFDSKMQQRALELETALKNNKAAVLIKEGLLPTIVESVDMVNDPFTYKSLLEEKVSNWTDKMPKVLRAAGKTLYMTHDTKVYKYMSGAAQLSDFTSRYALYHYNTRLKKGEKMSHQEAVQASSEVFINYDVPTHKMTQWLNDVGLLFYTKYYWRVQKQLARNMREKTARTAAMTMVEMTMGSGMSVIGSALPFIAGNPLHTSILKYPGAVMNTMLIKGLNGL